MTRIASPSLLVACVLFSATARADVKVEDKSSAKFEGVAGKLMNRSTAKGQVRTVAVKGDRKLTLDESSSELIDLKEERIYRLDHKAKTYEVTTFAEMRKQMQEAAKDSRDEEEAEPADSKEPEDQYEVELDVKQTGGKKEVNGFPARQVIATVTVHKKGMTLDQGGGTVITSDQWLAADVKAQNEIAEFDRRYMKKLYGDEAMAAFGDLELAMLSGPGMGKGMQKLREETGKMQGYPVLVTTTFERVKAPEPAVADEAPTSASGLGGFFAKKVAQKVAKRGGPRSTLLTTTNEVVSVSTSVAPSDVEMPAGYTERKKKK